MTATEPALHPLAFPPPEGEGPAFGSFENRPLSPRGEG